MAFVAVAPPMASILTLARRKAGEVDRGRRRLAVSRRRRWRPVERDRMNVGWRVVIGWALVGAGLLLALYLLSGILLPFIVGMAAAYLLDPLADWLQRRGFRRGMATLLITALFFALLVLLVLVLLPVAIEQAIGLGAKLPGYFDELRVRLLQLVERLENQNVVAGRIGRGPGVALRPAGAELCRHRAQQRACSPAWSCSTCSRWCSSPPSSPSTCCATGTGWWRRSAASCRPGITPRPAAWPARSTRCWPASCAARAWSACSSACSTRCGLMLVGLDYGAIIGLLTGLFSFIPYVGMLVGVAVGLTVAVFQFGAVVPVALVGAVFALGQFIEGNFLTPTGGRQPHPPARGLGDLRRARRHRPVRPDRHLPRHPGRRGDRGPGPLRRRALAPQRLFSRGHLAADHEAAASDPATSILTAVRAPGHGPCAQARRRPRGSLSAVAAG